MVIKVVKITVSCESKNTTGVIYILEDASLYPVCEILARDNLQVVSVETIDEPSDDQLREALMGARVVPSD